MLVGRAEERARLDEIVDAVRSGESRVLVLRGDRGVGKSALLEYVERRAGGARVLRVPGVEVEKDLDFAALHQLCAPLADRLPRLPEPQRTAIETVFGIKAGPRPDHFLVGLAVLNLMTHASADRPLLCLVDDAHWLDRASAQVLAFVARRLLAESIAIVFATHQPRHPFLALPELEVRGLAEPEADALLATVVPAGLDPTVRHRILAEARGNPLALLGLPQGMTVTQLAGGLGMVETDTPPGPLELSFLDRIRDLSAPTQLVMLVAAADLSGDPRLVRRAIERLGVRDQVAVRDEVEGLLILDGGVIFRHPLVRSAAYRAAGAKARREAHRALAEVTDPKVDADRRAWHRAAASAAPDEFVALELEGAVEQARTRGGLPAAAAFLQRATVLSEDGALRSSRALAASRVSLRAGDLDAARRYLDVADRGPSEGAPALQPQLVHAQLVLALDRRAEAGALLHSLAHELEGKDPVLARETYLNAWGAAAAAGDDGRLLDVSRAVAALPEPSRPQLTDQLLSGYARLALGQRPAAVELLRSAAEAIPSTSPADLLRLGWAASGLGPTLWDDDLFRSTCLIQVQASRQDGALTQLARHLTALALTTAWTGDLAGAGSLIAEAELLATATGQPADLDAALFSAALRGDDRATSALTATARERARTGGHEGDIALARWSSAVLNNGRARYDLATRAAREAAALSSPWISVWVLPELVEAAVRVGDGALAAWALRRVLEATQGCSSDWALGIAARCRALMVGAQPADDLFVEAIQRLGRTCWCPETARARLLYGEWLRREGRRVDAREQLHEAHDTFDAMGMGAFAERARRELLATGATPRRRAAGTTARELTPQERQIANLVRDGYSNTEVAARLFLSPRTVEWHLRKVFTKLSITSRRQLREALPRGEQGVDPAAR